MRLLVEYYSRMIYILNVQVTERLISVANRDQFSRGVMDFSFENPTIRSVSTALALEANVDIISK